MTQMPPPAFCSAHIAGASSSVSLPLRLLSVQETLENSNLLGQGFEPDSELRFHLGLVFAELGVEVLAVWARAHGSAEDWLHEEGVVGLECCGI